MNIAHPGFADPEADSQACFRAVLEAMSRPGHILRATAPAEPPPGLDRATAAVLLTLVDAETPLWIQAPQPAQDWVAFHCGAPQAAADAAAFALATGPVALDGFCTGTDDAPELGTTVILQVAALGTGQALHLSGPGLARPTTLHVTGLPPGFPAAWEANRALFPRGIDVILCAGDRLAALPRTVRIGTA